MQASRINVGGHYAANIQGKYEMKVVDLYVTEISTVKSSDGTKSYVTGWYGSKDDRTEVKRLPVADVIDDLANHTALQAQKEKEEAERKAKQEAREAKQWDVVQRLAKAIDAQAVKSRYGSHRYGDGDKWDQNAPAVIVDGSSIQINEHAFDNLEAFLQFHEKGAERLTKVWDEENYTKR